MWAHTMAYSGHQLKQVFCLKISTLQQWEASCNISNLLGPLLWDVQPTVHSAHLYNLHWIKINVFPFIEHCWHFHSNKLKPLHFCESIWHFALHTKDIKYFRCLGGEHLFSLIISNADFSICISYSWCNAETVFRAWPWISEHKSVHVLTVCSETGNSRTRQLLSARATHTAHVCPATLSSKCTSVQQRRSQSIWFSGCGSVHLICTCTLNLRYHKASKSTLGAHIEMHPILMPRHSNSS